MAWKWRKRRNHETRKISVSLSKNTLFGVSGGLEILVCY